MNKRMLIPNCQSWHPPVGHIRMIAIGDMNGSPAAQRSFILVIEPLQPVQIMQIPSEGALLTIDLKSVKGLVATRVPGRLERRQRSILKSSQERARVVDPNLFHFASQVVFPLFNECFGSCR